MLHTPGDLAGRAREHDLKADKQESKSALMLGIDHKGARSMLTVLDSRAGELPRPGLKVLRISAVALMQETHALTQEAHALTQETHALAYESAQFAVDDLWHMAAAPRARVLALREKVFGTGRRLPQGVRGAHGPFSRVQWTLDGEERLVDRMGRTESEAEEEEELPHLPGMEMEMEEEIDVVEHQNLKPTWLLRFFNYWGGRLGLSRTQEPPTTMASDGQPKPAESSKSEPQNGNSGQVQAGQSDSSAARVGRDGNGASTSVGLPTDDARTQMLQRTFTS